jgi:hypothetical protein
VKGRTAFGLGGTLIITCAAARTGGEVSMSWRVLPRLNTTGRSAGRSFATWCARRLTGCVGGSSGRGTRAGIRLIHTYWGWGDGRRCFAYGQSVWH